MIRNPAVKEASDARAARTAERQAELREFFRQRKEGVA